MRRIAAAMIFLAASYATAHADTYVYNGTVLNHDCPPTSPCLNLANIAVETNGNGTFGSGAVTGAFFQLTVQNSIILFSFATPSSTFTGSPLSFAVSNSAAGSAGTADLNWAGGTWDLTISRPSGSWNGTLSGVTFNNTAVSAIPEPATASLLLAGLGALALGYRTKARRR